MPDELVKNCDTFFYCKMDFMVFCFEEFSHFSRCNCIWSNLPKGPSCAKGTSVNSEWPPAANAAPAVTASAAAVVSAIFLIMSVQSFSHSAGCTAADEPLTGLA